MKDNDSKTLQGLSRDDGMTVPEGYFADFAKRMEAMLPEQEWERAEETGRVMPRTFWQKVRPYAYMAAMFAGVWCMMKTFNLMQSSSDSIPAMPATLAEAVSDDSFMSDYYISDMDETEFFDELYDNGFTPTSLTATNL